MFQRCFLPSGFATYYIPFELRYRQAVRLRDLAGVDEHIAEVASVFVDKKNNRMTANGRTFQVLPMCDCFRQHASHFQGDALLMSPYLVFDRWNPNQSPFEAMNNLTELTWDGCHF